MVVLIVFESSVVKEIETEKITTTPTQLPVHYWKMGKDAVDAYSFFGSLNDLITSIWKTPNELRNWEAYSSAQKKNITVQIGTCPLGRPTSLQAVDYFLWIGDSGTALKNKINTYKLNIKAIMDNKRQKCLEVNINGTENALKGFTLPDMLHSNFKSTKDGKKSLYEIVKQQRVHINPENKDELAVYDKWHADFNKIKPYLNLIRSTYENYLDQAGNFTGTEASHKRYHAIMATFKADKIRNFMIGQETLEQEIKHLTNPANYFTVSR